MIFTFTAGTQTISIEEKNEKRALKKALRDMDFKGAWSKENKTKKNVAEKVAKRTKSNFSTPVVEKKAFVPIDSNRDWIMKVIKRCQTTTSFTVVCNTLQKEGILEICSHESKAHDLQVGISRGGWVITYKGVDYAYVEPVRDPKHDAVVAFVDDMCNRTNDEAIEKTKEMFGDEFSYGIMKFEHLGYKFYAQSYEGRYTLSASLNGERVYGSATTNDKPTAELDGYRYQD